MNDNYLIYTRIYNKLRKIINFNELKKTRRLKLKSNGHMDLRLNFLYDMETGFSISLIHNYEQNGDLMCDPDVKVRIYPNLCVAEALAYQNGSLGIYNVINEEGS